MKSIRRAESRFTVTLSLNSSALSSPCWSNGAPEGDAWLHEVKIDGYRAAAIIERGQVRMYSRNANDWTARFQPIPHNLANLKVKSAYLDGEVAMLDSDGVSSFEALQEALGRSRKGARPMWCSTS